MTLKTFCDRDITSSGFAFYAKLQLMYQTDDFYDKKMSGVLHWTKVLNIYFNYNVVFE